MNVSMVVSSQLLHGFHITQKDVIFLLWKIKAHSIRFS